MLQNNSQKYVDNMNKIIQSEPSSTDANAGEPEITR